MRRARRNPVKVTVRIRRRRIRAFDDDERDFEVIVLGGVAPDNQETPAK
jgi:hypothetical protein